MDKDKTKLIDIVSQSREIFFGNAEICNKQYRQDDGLRFYRDLIACHRNVNNISKLLASDDFMKNIHATLVKWNMAQQGAKLVSIDIMSDSIRSHQEMLIELYKYRIESIAEYQLLGISRQLRQLFCGLEIMASKRRIVGVSKAIHFLLPDLAMPIDGKYTLPAFYGYNRYVDSAEKESIIYNDIFMKTYEIIKKLKISRTDVSGNTWSCSVPKLIDNAIIGILIRAKDIIKRESIQKE
jgi:aromatic ring-cleaving dioxygenase